MSVNLTKNKDKSTQMQNSKLANKKEKNQKKYKKKKSVHTHSTKQLEIFLQPKNLKSASNNITFK